WLAEAAVGIDPGRVLAATTSPTSRVGPMIARLAALGNVLVIEPDVARARWMVGRLNRAGLRAHGHPRQWAAGFTGGVVVGSRSAVWAPLPDPVAVVVLDEHDESLQEERTPTWHARDVAVERARRSGARCVLAGPILSPAALAAADEVVHAPRTEMRRGWPLVEVVDRRRDDLGFNSLFSPRLANVLRSAERAVVVLNRKGRAHLLACATCGALARSEDGRHVMTEDEGGLVAPATGERRPLVCADCGGTSLKRLRLGVSRAAEELGRLVDRPVVEIGSDRSRSDQSEKSAIVLGTEAALRALDRCDVVAFLDFDQELLAPRYRAAQQAMALLARGAELVGGRRDVSRLLVQTRVPDHPVLRAASTADPATLSRRESESRRAMGWPPFGALAEVSGDGAPAMADALAVVMSADPELARRCTLLGPRQDGRYLVSVGPGEVDAGQVLADLLAAVPRPRQRLRVVVDPPRA
ncbi:MAG: hypothetical protein OER95_16885, partial [Acidimicrobiia bacterium]|nr:hypothetical protein [Acidimicrobiia bacterium]